MGLTDRALGKEDADMRSAEDQPDDDRKIASFVKNRVEESRTHPSRIANEAIWMTNHAALLGFSGVYFDTRSRQFTPNNSAGRAIGKKNRISVNKILPSAQNRAARLAKNQPRFDVKPNGTSAEEKDLARLKVQVGEMLWDKTGIRTQRVPLYMNVQKSGHAYIKVSWDPALGKPVPDPETGDLIYEGEIRTDVYSPLQCFWDPLAKSFADLEWFATATIRKLDYFREQFPERGGAVQEEGCWLVSVQNDQILSQMNSVSGPQGINNNTVKNSAIEIAYYEKRSKHHPGGRMIIVANGVKLEDKDLPVGEIPFAKFDDIDVATYCPEAVITHARPLQERKNELQSKKDSFVRKMLAGKYIAAKGHGLKQESYNDASGEILEFTPVPGQAPPQPSPMPILPQYVYAEEDNIDRNFDDIFGINEVSKGQLPSAGIPAIGMQLLTEQDDTRIGIMTMQHELSWARVMMLMLLYAAKCYQTPRLLKASSGAQEYVIKEFTGADLMGDHDVIVIPGSTLPGSKTLKRQEIINVWTQGLLGDPADPKVREKVLAMLEFGESSEMWKDQALNKKQAQEVINGIEGKGPMPLPDERDANEYILVELNNYRKERSESLTPEQHLMIDQAMNDRIDIIVSLNNPQLAAEDALGPPPEPPMPDPSLDPSLDPGLPAPDMMPMDAPPPPPAGAF